MRKVIFLLLALLIVVGCQEVAKSPEVVEEKEAVKEKAAEPVKESTQPTEKIEEKTSEPKKVEITQEDLDELKKDLEALESEDLGGI